MKQVLPLWLMLFWTSSSTALSSDKITLATQLYQDGVTGSQVFREKKIIPVLQCIFDDLGLEMDVLQMPWVRAKRELQAGNVEGIFLTSENNISLGVPTNPIYLEKWHAYTAKPASDLGGTPRLGVIRGSDEQQWLQTNGVTLFMEAVSYTQLVKQLVADRVQAFIADSKSLNFNHLASEETESLHSTFVRYAAKTLTFSKQYVAANPNVLQQFNAGINRCNTEITQLSEVERTKILEYVNTTILPQFDTSKLQNIPEQLTEVVPDEVDVMTIDSAWRDAFAKGLRTQTAESLLTNDFSLKLRQIKRYGHDS